ncbi:MAG: signal recognition particle protein [Actinobacteria bacterium]|nr:signal recognition particle protein [Actinomycetota bacterium]
MFDSLTDRFEGIITRLRSRGKLTEKDIDEVAREIRLALLEADVNVRVVKSFVTRLKERANGAEVAKSLSPAQQVVKIVHEELVVTLGGDARKLTVNPKPPTVILLAGLQGSGKTTAAAKLARWLERDGKRPLLVGADLQRPAAVEQLRVLGERIGVPVASIGTDPVEVARNGIEEAARLGRNVVIVDTAGRLQIDTDLMAELRAIADAVAPDDSLLVVDAMTGQEAVNVAEAFAETVDLTGIVLTKLDGDARGGAALSVKEVTGRPIMFAGVGEKLEDFEAFHPDRMASRILGMGDVLTLIEKAEEAFDADQAAAAAERLQTGAFTLQDFLDQMRQMRKMGPLQNLVAMLPGVPKELRDADVDESQLGRIEAIICSMTPEERADPAIIDGSRRIRIAQGSGTAPQDVNALLKQFKQVSQMMKQLSRVSKRGKRTLTGLPPGLDLGALGAGGGPPGSGGRRR